MTETMDCQEVRISLGVYVLGAIDPAERAQVDSHLVTCRDCRDELAGLAGLPALLARVDVAEAIALGTADGPAPGGALAAAPPPPALLNTVIDLTAARRKRRRWREASLGLAAALIIAVGLFSGLRIGSGSGSSVDSGAALGPWDTVTGSLHGMSATVQYRPMGWGTQVDVKVNGIPVGTKCWLYIIGANGSRSLAGSWMTDSHEGEVWYPASAALPSTAVSAFQITVGPGQPITVSA